MPGWIISSATFLVPYFTCHYLDVLELRLFPFTSYPDSVSDILDMTKKRPNLKLHQVITHSSTFINVHTHRKNEIDTYRILSFCPSSPNTGIYHACENMNLHWSTCLIFINARYFSTSFFFSSVSSRMAVCRANCTTKGAFARLLACSLSLGFLSFFLSGVIGRQFALDLP